MQKNERNDSLDIMRFISAFMIVCIHIPFYGQFGVYFKAIARYAVPFFFIISGYFYESTVESGNRDKQIRKIFSYFLMFNITWMVWKALLSLLAQDIFILQYLSVVLNCNSFLKFVVFNESPFEQHLWYLGAILYILILLRFVNQKKRNILYKACPLLLIANVILGKYSVLLFGRDISILYSRNYLLCGLPCFAVGGAIKIYEKRIKSYINEWRLLFSILLFSALSVWEQYFLNLLDRNASGEVYISTIFLASSIFMYAIYMKIPENKVISKFAKIGAKDNILIYVFHPMIITVANIVAKRSFWFNAVYCEVGPIIVFLATVLGITEMKQVLLFLQSFKFLKIK